MITYRLADFNDNDELIKLTAATGMEGETALRIDRKPNFFSLLNLRGKSIVFAGLAADKIIGMLCLSLQHVYIDGKVTPLWYIGDFKVHEAYRKKGIGLQLCNNAADYLLGINAELVFLNVSKGNTRPLPFFSNRPNVPDFDNIGFFNIYQFIGIKKYKQNPGVNINATGPTDKLISFLNSHFCRYELGSTIDQAKLTNCLNYIVEKDEEIIAAMCLMDTMPFKQNIVTRLSLKMKLLLKSLNTFSAFAGISKMPVVNEPVKMLYIKYFAVKNADKSLAQSLVNFARNIVYKQSYSFVSIGLHEKDPLAKSFDGLFKITFGSMGMLLSIKNNRELIAKVKQGVPFEDYSLV